MRLHVLSLAALLLMAWTSVAFAEERALGKADVIAQKIAQIRGLAVKAPITKGLKDRAQLRASLKEKIAKELPPQVIAAEQAMMIHLGLLAEDQDLERLILDILTEEIAGYYDSDAGELFVIKDDGLSDDEVTLAHELFHALQDQHFTLNTIMGPKEGLAGTLANPDRGAARAALVEGDATLVMLDFTLYEAGTLAYGSKVSLLDRPLLATMVETQFASLTAAFGDGDSALGRAPRWMQMELQFPYVEGFAFVKAIRTGRSWEALNAVYQDPPDSTEQILHPERYLTRDAPVLLALDGAAILEALGGEEGGWRPFYTSVMGEYRIRLWLETFLDAGEDAAAGWDGDRVEGFRRGEEVMSVMASVWDSEEDAQEFAAAMVALHGARGRALSYQGEGAFGSLWCGLDGGRHTLVERWGARVLVVHGVPEEDALDLGFLRDTVWSALRGGEYPKTPRPSPRVFGVN